MVEETMEGRRPSPDLEHRFESVEVTVMCTELVGFGACARELSAIEEAEFLFEYNTEMTDIILEHDGTLDKYDKGNIVAFFGDPVRNVQHAERACSASLEMRERLSSKWGAETGLKLRAGLSTGEVVVGNMGSTHRAEYTVAGDALNLAKRLVHVERRMGASTVISADTRTRIDEQFEVQELDRITYADFQEPVTVYGIVCRKGELTEEDALLMARYDEGLKLYRERKWAKALERFKESGVDDLGYGFSRRYATRCWLHLEVPEFEKITHLQPSEIEEVLRRTDQRDLQEALREMEVEFRQVFLNQMSQRVRRWMEDETEAIQRWLLRRICG